ncbi:MAG TPA: hypothetical protein VF292_06685 [Rhodanobacteraceae bacterium]
MFNDHKFHRAEPVVWVRNGRGGPGYEDRAVGRIVRASVGRVTIQVYRADDQAWVIRSVAPGELHTPARADLERLDQLERTGRKAA